MRNPGCKLSPHQRGDVSGNRVTQGLQIIAAFKQRDDTAAGASIGEQFERPCITQSCRCDMFRSADIRYKPPQTSNRTMMNPISTARREFGFSSPGGSCSAMGG